MKAPVMEIFSSIQGEGLLIGRRQIFVRFAGCNFDCVYCDTPQSRDPAAGEEISCEELLQKVQNIMTPDFHSLSFTGGEPLLYADFIKKFLKENRFNSLLETNGSLPKEVNKIAGFITHASVDIKLDEHLASSDTDDIIEREIEVINILISRGVNTYCKVVVLPSTEVDSLGRIAKKIRSEISDPSKVPMVIQPASPLEYWIQHSPRLFQMSEIAGEQLEVLTIPQVHKLLNVR